MTANVGVSDRAQNDPVSNVLIALFALHAGLIGWACRPVGMLLIAAAVLNLWRLWRWRGGETVAEPLLLILHVGTAG
jgi:uncharacterized protein involved in response to NO